MILRFTPEAEAELTEARGWYSHHHQDLDLEFMECIEVALSLIRSNPHLFPVVYRSLRRAVVRRFPFAIFYEVSADEIQIVAVFHSRRNPEVWKSR
ncbi:MAG TPA: type II toxin-antitoxin system RelE/ParE family toxin [Pyrinomonadaceae bacterium]|nr:type II toxin-antitoxin system RelE/ParE family toxin [Pyrinomonadaceae bacterium]